MTEPFDSCSSFTDAAMTIFICFTTNQGLNLFQETWKVPSLSEFITFGC